MAIVIRSDTGRHGAIVEVLEFAGPSLMSNGNVMIEAWEVSNPRDDRKTQYFCEDKDMLPIRPGDLDETEETSKELEVAT